MPVRHPWVRHQTTTPEWDDLGRPGHQRGVHLYSAAITRPLAAAYLPPETADDLALWVATTVPHLVALIQCRLGRRR